VVLARRRMSGRRKLAFPPLPYIVVYQVKENAIESREYSTARRNSGKVLSAGMIVVGAR
jgi:hypothetical protein